MSRSVKRPQIVIEADKYLGMQLGKAKKAETFMRRMGMYTRIVKRGEDRYGVRVSFRPLGGADQE